MLDYLGSDTLNGFSTSEANQQALEDPNFLKYFQAFTSSESVAYTQAQSKKLFILVAMFIESKAQAEGHKTDFFAFIERYLTQSGKENNAEDTPEKRLEYSVQGGLKFSLTLLKQLNRLQPEILQESLEQLLEILKDIPPRGLYSLDKISFLMDKQFDDTREFLVEIVQSETYSHQLKTVCLRVMLMLGVVRANSQDLLCVATLLGQ